MARQTCWTSEDNALICRTACRDARPCRVADLGVAAVRDDSAEWAVLAWR